MALIPIKKLRRDGGTQCRVVHDPDTVAIYAEHYLDGKKMPPVQAIFDGKDYWLWDGFQRCEAAQQAGEKDINVEVAKGTHRDAFRLSLGANREHGRPSTNADKRAAVMAALQDSEFAQLTNRQLAELCQVSHTFVNGIRFPKDEVVRVAPQSVSKVLEQLQPQPATEGETERDAELAQLTGVETFPPAGDAEAPAEPASVPGVIVQNSDRDPGDVTIKKPAPVPLGSITEITADRDALRDKVAELASALEESIEHSRTLEEGLDLGDVQRALMAENTQLRERLRVSEETINGLLTEKNEAIRSAKTWQKKAKQLAAGVK